MSGRLEIDIAQFTLDTIGLDTLAIGAYVKMLVAYRHAGAIADDERVLAKICGLDLEDFDMRRNQLAELFLIENGYWTHSGIEEQIAKGLRLSRNAAKATAGAMRKIAAKTIDSGPPETTPAEPDPPKIDKAVPVQTESMHIGKRAPEPDDFGSPMQPEWQITPELLMQARDEGYSSAEIADVIDGFKRYHIAAGTIHPDWNEAWVKWWDRKKPVPPKTKPRVQVSRKAVDAQEQ